MSKISNLVGKKSIRKEVKEMRKLFAILAIMAMVVSTTTPAHAAFTRIEIDRYPALVTVEPGVGEPIVTFRCSLKNLANDEDATEVGWSAITAGTTHWLRANQYIEARGFATYEDWGIQIYTHNTNDNNPGYPFVADPKYTGTGNPAGLVRVDNTLYSLPTCWRTKVGYWVEDDAYPGDRNHGNPDKPGSGAITLAELEIYEGKSGGYTVLYDGVPGHQPGGTKEYFPWFFTLDKETPDVDLTTPGNQEFGNNQDEATFMGSKGYHHAPGLPNYATPSDIGDFYFIYLGANFTLTIPGKTYKTNAIIVESYHL